MFPELQDLKSYLTFGNIIIFSVTVLVIAVLSLLFIMWYGGKYMREREDELQEHKSHHVH